MLFPVWFIVLYLRFRPTVIHVHTEIPDLSLWLFRKIAWIFFWISPKYVRTIHNTELWNGWKPVGRMVEPYYMKHGCNIAISSSTKYCYERIFGVKNIPVVYNGISEVKQRSFMGLEKGKKHILFAGRLEAQKGVDTLIKVIKALRDDTNLVFHIVGNGSYEQRIREEIGNLSNVLIMDKIYGLPSYVGSFDFLFMPSEHEGLGLMAVEASLAHTPTIINRCMGLDEALPNDWPLAVNDNSVEGFVSIFRKLDDWDYVQLSNKAYLYAKEKFSIERMHKEYETIYQEA